MSLILQAVPEAPIWPQLPKRHWREGFLPQYAEGLPGLVEHPKDGKVSINRENGDFVRAMTAFYEAQIKAKEGGVTDHFKISPEHASGIAVSRTALSKLKKKPPFVKIHTTGPISFGLTVFDEKGMPLLYDQAYADIVLQNAVMKSLWQLDQFEPYGDRIICFFDEPILSAFGSSTYINLTRDMVVPLLSEAVQALKGEGALVGVHVCGNSEWTLLLDAEVDIISFDAYNYGESLALYPERVSRHLERGGALAWGIVPTSPDIHEQSAESLEKRLTHFVDHLGRQGMDTSLIWRQSMLTPSCGMGTMSVEEAELVMETLHALARRIQDRFPP